MAWIKLHLHHLFGLFLSILKNHIATSQAPLASFHVFDRPHFSLQTKFDWSVHGVDDKPLLSYGPCQFPTLGLIVQRAWWVELHAWGGDIHVL